MKRKIVFALIVFYLFTLIPSTVVNAEGGVFEYYYTLLNSDEKLLYNQMKSDVAASRNESQLSCSFTTLKLKFEINNLNITSQDELNAVFNNYVNEDATYKNNMSLLQTYFQNAVNALLYDHVEYYFLFDGENVNISYSYSTNANYSNGTLTLNIAVTLKYHSTLDSNRSDYNAMMNAAKALSLSGTAYDKIKAIHDYICNINTYSSSITNQSYCAYGSLVAHNSVCQGYAHAFKIICDLNGIDCICVSGIGVTTSGSERHMWNLVKLDGKWYGVDITWDDQYEILYDYFLAGSDTVDTHFAKVKFTASHREDKSYVYPSPVSSSAYVSPDTNPTATPTQKPTATPTQKPTATPTQKPTATPTQKPTEASTQKPTEASTQKPTEAPTEVSSQKPTDAPGIDPTDLPTNVPSDNPTEVPDDISTDVPTEAITAEPTPDKEDQPTEIPTEPVSATEEPTASDISEPDITDSPSSALPDENKSEPKNNVTTFIIIGVSAAAAVLVISIIISKKSSK